MSVAMASVVSYAGGAMGAAMGGGTAGGTGLAAGMAAMVWVSADVRGTAKESFSSIEQK